MSQTFGQSRMVLDGRMTREVKGPGLAGLAVLAKPQRIKPPEWRLLDIRNDDKARKVYEDKIKDAARFTELANFETRGEAKAKSVQVTLCADRMEAEANDQLNLRRDRLRDLLLAEENMYVEEALSLGETSLERQAKMRARSKELRDARQKEAEEFVEVQRDRIWRASCDPLRDVLVQKNHARADQTRFHQMEVKKQQKEEEKVIDAMYADLWQKDMESKMQREELERAMNLERKSLQRDANKGIVREHEDARRREKALIEEEKKLRLEHTALMEEEDRLEKLAQQHKQQKFKTMLDAHMAEDRATQKAKMEKQMAEDMALLEQIQRETREAVASAQGGRERLAREAKQYHEYLSALRAHRIAEERECEMWRESERRKVEAKQLDQWRRERQVRKDLMLSCVNVLQQQLMDKLLIFEERRKEVAEEKLACTADIKLMQQEQHDLAVQQNIKAAEYARELGGQIKANRVSKEAEREAEKQADRDRVEANRIEGIKIDELVSKAKLAAF